MDRNRCADLLRVCAIGAVVLGHWLLVSVTYRGGQLSGSDALLSISWARWVTLVLQVMPVFFLVGGYVNARSWTVRHEQGETWTDWVRRRTMTLMWPTALYVGTIVLTLDLARSAGAAPADLARIGWLVALHLWFLPVYLILIALTPLALAAHRRWGLAVPVAMAATAAAVDVAVLGAHEPVVGYVNYLLVWGAMHQWGFAWQDGTLTRPRSRCVLLAGTGLVSLTVLLTLGPFPVDMIGAGRQVGNTSPPSIALLAFAATQTGLLLAAEPVLTRLVSRPAWARSVSRLNRTVMTVYLWHMVPVALVAVAFYPTGVMPQPAIGTGEWWVLRAAWLALLATVLVPLVLLVNALLWPLRRLPAGLGPGGRWSPVLMAGSLVAAVPAFLLFATRGFAPGGHPPMLALALFTGSVLAALLSGRPAGAAPPSATPVPAGSATAGRLPRAHRGAAGRGRSRHQPRSVDGRRSASGSSPASVNASRASTSRLRWPRGMAATMRAISERRRSVASRTVLRPLPVRLMRISRRLSALGSRSSMPAFARRSTIRMAVEGMTSRCSPSREMFIAPRLSSTTSMRNWGRVSVSSTVARERADTDTRRREAVRTAVTTSSATSS